MIQYSHGIFHYIWSLFLFFRIVKYFSDSERQYSQCSHLDYTYEEDRQSWPFMYSREKNDSLRQVEGTLEKRLNNSNKRSILRQGEIGDLVIKTNNLT